MVGTKPHGFPELKIASWQDTELIKTTKSLAQKVFNNPEEYKKLSVQYEKKRILPN